MMNLLSVLWSLDIPYCEVWYLLKVWKKTHKLGGLGFLFVFFFYLTGLGHVWAVMGKAVFVLMTWVG